MSDFGTFMVALVAIVGAFTFAIVSAVMRARIRELEIRRRIAMIEKGLVPPPEVDPPGFERAMHRLDRAAIGANRHRRAGITLVGAGFGLMVLIGFAGESPAQGLGVGGFLVILGLAFFVNGLFEGRQPPPPPPGGALPADPRVPPPAGS